MYASSESTWGINELFEMAVSNFWICPVIITAGGFQVLAFVHQNREKLKSPTLVTRIPKLWKK